MRLDDVDNRRAACEHYAMSARQVARGLAGAALLATALVGCSANDDRDKAIDDAIAAYDPPSVEEMGRTADCIESGYDDWSAARGCYNH